MLLDNTKNQLRQICAGLMTLSYLGFAHAQFESEPVSVALDNTDYQCYGDGFRPSTDDFTTGNSSVASFANRPIGNAALAGCFIAGGKTISFDWRFTKSGNDEIVLNAYGEFGEIHQLARLSTTSDWRTETVYLPLGVESFNWDLLNFEGAGLAWIDNLRVVEGNQTGGSGSGGSGSGGSGSSGGQSSQNPLSQAVDNLGYEFFTFGDALFSAQSNVVKVGATAAQSGNVDDDEFSVLYTVVEGGKKITFDWKSSSEQGFDGMVFYYVDSQGTFAGDVESITGITGWQSMTSKVPGTGLHFVVWAYTKDEDISSGQDRGWVDNVQISDDKSSAVIPAITLLLLGDN